MFSIEQKKILLEDLVLQTGDRHQLVYLQTRATEQQLTDEEYLDYLCCYFKEAKKEH